MKLRIAIFVLSCCSYLEIIGSAKILAIHPFPYYSHFKAFQPLLEELIKRGHSLTLVSPISLNDEFQNNYTHLNIAKYVTPDPSRYESNLIKALKMNPFEKIINSIKNSKEMTEEAIKCPEVQKLIHSKVDYDLIIGELFFSSDIFFALGNKFNAPIITITSQCLLPFHSWMVGNPDPHYFPNSFLKETEKMSLISRAVNVGFQLFSNLYYEFYGLPLYQSLIEKYFDFEKGKIPNMKDVMKNISVSFVNSHYSLGYNKPELPNVVNVAGIHFTRPKPLPPHIQKFMDEAEYGVIYVSFGSLIVTSPFYQLGVTLIGILKMLPQRIIIKWDQKLMPYASKNIMIGEWFSQPDILNHPNCRLFITHGGYLSLLESLNASVPVVGIPFYGDQFYNLAMVEYFELGMKIEKDNVPSELPGKINEVLENPKYKNNMQKRSLLFRNRLASPLDTAMYWVDHVLKHKDTSHLKPASVRLTWYEFYSLDVLGVLLVLAGVIFCILKFILSKSISLVLILYTRASIWCDIKSRQKGTKYD